MEVNMAKELSYYKSSVCHNFMFVTIPELLDRRFREIPDAEYCVFLEYLGQDRPLIRSRVTWRDLHDNSLRVSAQLLKLGLKPDDRIAIYGRSIPEWLYVAFGCIRIKVLCIPIPVSLLYSDKLGQFLNDHRVKLLVLDPGHDSDVVEKLVKNVSQVKRVVQNEGATEIGYPSGIVFLRRSGTPSGGGISSVADFAESDLTTGDSDSVREIQERIDPDDAAMIYATSGSTGIPKLVVHSHFTTVNMYLSTEYTATCGRIYFNDRPFSWLGSDFLYCLIHSSTLMHLNAPSMTHEEYAKVILRIVKDEQVTAALFMTYILQHIRRMIKSGTHQLSDTLKLIVTGGEKIPDDMIRDLSEHVNLMVAYASTEVPLLGYFMGTDTKYTLEDGEEGFLFQPTGPIEIKIVNEEELCVPYGTRGALLTRQPTMFLGYLDEPDATKAAIGRGRWCSSGDMAIMHPSGRFQLLGRTSDVIIKGGVKIYPSKQEAMLLEFEKLSKTLVCSIPDEYFHEEICAYVVPKSGSHVTIEELRVHCEKYQPAANAVPLIPKYFIIGDNLPILPNGKVDKKQVRNMFIELTKI